MLVGSSWKISRLQQINFTAPPTLRHLCGRPAQLRQTFLCALYHHAHTPILHIQHFTAFISHKIFLMLSLSWGVGDMKTQPIAVKLPQTKDISMF